MVTPDGAPWAPRPRVDNAMVKALARAFRWQRMLDEGVCGTIEELAKREKVNRGYMSRVLRLTLLAPDIVEAILDGRQPEGTAAGGFAGGVLGRVEGPAGAARTRSLRLSIQPCRPCDSAPSSEARGYWRVEQVPAQR